MLSKNTETFLGCDKDYDRARIVIFGAPFDSTTSYRPGTRFAAKTMRAESFGLETYSPYQDKDLEETSVFDSGDMELCFGDTEKALQQIEDFTSDILQDDKLPLMIGGEHLLTLATVRAMFAKYPNLNIIHLDAHTDLREDYLGAKLSHATVMRRIWELVGDNKIWQFAIRSGEKAEFTWAKEHTHLQKFNFAGLEQAVQYLKGRPVYLTLDLDVLDPSIFPGTGTPEAGGVSFLELLDAIQKISQLHIVGCDLMELCPVYDQSGVSTATACKILRELLLSL